MNTELLTLGTLAPRKVRSGKATRWERSSIVKTGVTQIFTISAASVVAPLIAAAPGRPGPESAKPSITPAGAVASLATMHQSVRVALARK